jgi:hypothetical protein
MRQQDDSEHSDRARGGDRQEGAGETAGLILDVADHVSPKKAGEVAERVNSGDAAGRRGAGEKGGRQGPDQRQRGEDVERAYRDEQHFHIRIVDESRGGHAGRSKEQRHADGADRV